MTPLELTAAEGRLILALRGVAPDWLEEMGMSVVAEGRDTDDEWGDRAWSAFMALAEERRSCPGASSKTA